MKLTFVSITNQDLKQGKGRKDTHVHAQTFVSHKTDKTSNLKTNLQAWLLQARNNQGFHSSREQQLRAPCYYATVHTFTPHAKMNFTSIQGSNNFQVQLDFVI